MKATYALTQKQEELYRALSGDAQHVMAYGGSRSGKTFALCRAVAIRALKEPNSRHAILRFRFNHVKQAVWYDTWPKMLKLCFPGLVLYENKSDWFMRFPNGSEVWFGGLDDKARVEKILGNEYATIYFNECSQISWLAITTALTRLAQRTGLRNRAYYDCNPPSTRHWTYKLFVQKMIPETNEKLSDNLAGNYAYMQLNPQDNAKNLSEDYIDGVLASLPYRQRQRFMLGEFQNDVDGALWRQEWIDAARDVERPQLERLCVALDPAVTASKNSDETGIIIAGIDRQKAGYILEDLSGKFTPDQWAQKAVAAYKTLNANAIVAEANNGGDLVKAVIKQYDPSANIVLVRAAHGKMPRAEPIASLYEQGRIHHIGYFPELEEQMCTYTGDVSESSPDRMDALVWGIDWLMIDHKPMPWVR